MAKRTDIKKINFETQNMIEHQIDGMPVVRKNENGRLKVVGRVTKTNVTKAFVALGNQE